MDPTTYVCVLPFLQGYLTHCLNVRGAPREFYSELTVSWGHGSSSSVFWQHMPEHLRGAAMTASQSPCDFYCSVLNASL